MGALLREGFVAAGFPAERIAPQVYREEEAVRDGLETARPGDLLVIFGDDLGRVWDQIVGFGGRSGTAPATTHSLFAPETQPLWAIPNRRPDAPEEAAGED